MKLTYYGHSCFGVEVDGTHLLFDPFITPNPKAAAIDVTKVPADYILLSHGHFDHVADVVAIAKRTGATLIANWDIVEWFAKQGVDKAHAMNLGGAKQFPGPRGRPDLQMTDLRHLNKLYKAPTKVQPRLAQWLNRISLVAAFILLGGAHQQQGAASGPHDNVHLFFISVAAASLAAL